jgi:ribosome maturation factor RimP
VSNASAPRVRAVVEPVVIAAGCDLEDVVVRRAGSRHLVQVVVDKDGGISLDDVADVSRVVSDALDASDAIAGAYVLEVGSPGVDRPLTEPRHWRRNVGRLVAVHRNGAPLVTGRVLAADETTLRLDVDGTETELALADVTKGAVQVEFGP